MRTFPKPHAKQVISLLEQHNLSTSDLEGNTFEHFFGCGEADNPAGVVGLDLFGDIGLLRSLAVTSDNRGKGSGKALVETVERHAQANGVKTLFLLTDSAARFFARLGYLAVKQEKAPEVIQQSAEFAHLGSDDAVVMMKDIRKGHFMSIFP